MNFKTIQEYYPMGKTLIGFYSTDQSFQAHSYEEVKNIDQWEYAPLDWATNYFPFVYYNEETDYFECWMFAAWPVKGYYTNDPNGEDYQLITDEPDLGIEIIDPFNADEYHIIFKPYAEDDIEEKIIKLHKNDEYRIMLELAAYRWNPAEYLKGNIMTTYDAVKYFCKDMETSK